MRIDYIYKICTKKEWETLKKKKFWQGSKKDIEDGFIHLSNREQLNKTLKKYYYNDKNLILLTLKADTLTKLVWERSSDNEMFPHLYSNLKLDSVLDCKKIIGDQHLF